MASVSSPSGISATNRPRSQVGRSARHEERYSRVTGTAGSPRCEATPGLARDVEFETPACAPDGRDALPRALVGGCGNLGAVRCIARAATSSRRVSRRITTAHGAERVHCPSEPCTQLWTQTTMSVEFTTTEQWRKCIKKRRNFTLQSSHCTSVVFCVALRSTRYHFGGALEGTTSPP